MSILTTIALEKSPLEWHCYGFIIDCQEEEEQHTHPPNFFGFLSGLLSFDVGLGYHCIVAS